MRWCLVLSFVLSASLMGWSSRAAAAEPSLGRAEQQFDSFDIHGAIATAKALLERGGNGPEALQRIHEILGQCRIVTGQEAAATEHFRRLLALKPDYRASDDISPKIRRPLAQVLARWAGRPGLTVAHGPPKSAACDGDLKLVVKIVEDPVAMVHQVRVQYRTPGAKKREELKVPGRKGDITLALPLARRKLGPGALRYSLELLDRHQNILWRRAELTVRLERTPLPPPTTGRQLADAQLAARLERQAAANRRARRTRTIWGYATLGTGLAFMATAAALYGVGGVQGNDAHDKYTAAQTDDDILRYGEEVKAARDKLTAGHVMASVGVAAVAVSVYLLVTRPRAGRVERRSASAPSLGLAAAERGSLLSLSGTF